MSEAQGPCASYTDTCWKDRPGRHVGFNAVGPGWHSILADLDRKLIEILDGWDLSKLEIVQIKEKFGGLRVYYVQNSVDLNKETLEKIIAAVREAEERSLTVCEVCGSGEGVENRIRAGSRYGWTLTLCAVHHKERDETGKLTGL
jgi:hypothetical protein